MGACGKYVIMVTAELVIRKGRSCTKNIKTINIADSSISGNRWSRMYNIYAILIYPASASMHS